jgi:hypothetical protein
MESIPQAPTTCPVCNAELKPPAPHSCGARLRITGIAEGGPAWSVGMYGQYLADIQGIFVHDLRHSSHRLIDANSVTYEPVKNRSKRAQGGAIVYSLPTRKGGR